MKSLFLTLITLALSATACLAAPYIDFDGFGKSLGGWKKGGNTVDYPHSGSTYRTFRPEVSPTPDGGIFVSVRIDNVRGWFSNNDYAVLEITVSPKGNIASAQSSIAIQGRSISSDVIRGGTAAGQKMTGVDHAVQIGTDLVADLTSKLLQEKIVEAGRVSFPSVVRHNYNLLYQAIRTANEPKAIQANEESKPEVPVEKANPPADNKPGSVAPNKLEVKSYAPSTSTNLEPTAGSDKADPK
ncbi:MAG: hypothetical protein QM627_09870 [Luteolibacter sp.]